jgi:hypothetical protein
VSRGQRNESPQSLISVFDTGMTYLKELENQCGNSDFEIQPKVISSPIASWTMALGLSAAASTEVLSYIQNQL